MQSWKDIKMAEVGKEYHKFHARLPEGWQSSLGKKTQNLSRKLR